MELSGVIYLAISLLLIYSCYTDVKNRIISNRVSLSVMALSLVLMLIHREWTVLIIAVIVLVVGFFISIIGIIGAGDVKLACALLPGLTWSEGVDFLLLTGFVGIPVSLFTLLYLKVKGGDKKTSVPYGLAIAGGYGLQFLLR
ncbi:prepilin peptidase CpaA [Enterobacter sp. BIGb0383]|uniref:prepilin peptidase n=1 Tax=unclassified Enterobacter TaxID=2608935 RepID=UPI000F461A93|nr:MULTISPECIES: prepilin peptidase [unclassified Enterobacter]ROP59617.1 prepilin peptidase CpaA [Enterobacter sp. BIGb0383]ROS08915.1 prepilin peptidase CpaA [Enterobacter sp. BIGb0359]